MADQTPVLDKQYCRAHFGHMSQLCSVRRSYLMDGRARMLEALDFDNGTGLNFTVLPGRGMDIAWTKFRGTPISFMTKAGVASPESYDARNMEWLWNFFGGMLTTCGMSNVGDACEDQQPELGTVQYGLHGRLTNTAAAQVCYDAGWEGDRYRLWAKGQMREGILHGQNISLTRTISTELGSNTITVHDTVENEGFFPRELMLLYHINVGHPILGPGCQLYLPKGTKTVTSTSAEPCDPDLCGTFTEPEPGAPQHVFVHSFPKEDQALVALYQPKLHLGVALRFDPRQLPYFNQWTRMASGDYVVGLEPANCLAIGRQRMKKQGIEILQPGQIKEIEWTLTILDSEEALADFIRQADAEAKGV